MKKSIGFTMAEAILVMAILGVIAAVMIATIRPAEYKEKGLILKANKVLSEIDNATLQILTNDSGLGDMTTLFDENGAFQFGDDSSRVLNLYKKYLVISTKEVTQDSVCYKANQSIYTHSSVYLKDGACITITSGISGYYDNLIFPKDNEMFFAKSSQGAIFFDVNGEDEPNISGKDQFRVPVSNEGIMWDWNEHNEKCRKQDSEATHSSNTNCCKTYDSSCKCIECYKDSTCTGLMIQNTNICNRAR